MSSTNFDGLQTDLADLFNDPSRYAKFIQDTDLLSQSITDIANQYGFIVSSSVAGGARLGVLLTAKHQGCSAVVFK